MAEIWLTPEEIAKREERLEFLKTTRRLEIAEQLKIARAFGDLSENAEYDAAKNEQAKNEYDIVQLENELKNAKVIVQGRNGHFRICRKPILPGEATRVRVVTVAKIPKDKLRRGLQPALSDRPICRFMAHSVPSLPCPSRRASSAFRRSRRSSIA